MWFLAKEFLPEDLDALAWRTGALLRKRMFKSGEQLLRACLLYAESNSFRTSSALVRGSGLAKVSSEALFYRMGSSETFLQEVLAHLVDVAVGHRVGRRVLLVDATAVQGPASKGTDFRVHVAYDPYRAVPYSVIVDTSDIGEHLCLHGLCPGVLAIADRGYGTARNVDAALFCGADVLVRVQKGQMKLLHPDGGKANLADLEADVPLTGAVSFELDMPVPPESTGPGGWRTSQALRMHRVRLIGARAKGREVVWLLTNLGERALGAGAACELYRARWQVELYFKRLKSIGNIDDLLSRDGPTARATLIAKMILMVLTSLLQDREQAFSPYGYQVRERAKPVEGVRLHPEAASSVPSPTGAEPQTASGRRSEFQAAS
jgi:hypothetical protein